VASYNYPCALTCAEKRKHADTYGLDWRLGEVLGEGRDGALTQKREYSKYLHDPVSEYSDTVHLGWAVFAEIIHLVFGQVSLNLGEGLLGSDGVQARHECA
jgi:hypothetical protein